MVHSLRTIRSILCLACSLGPGYLSVRAWAEETQARDWHQLVRPFLQTYCLDCHSGSGAEAGIDFDAYQTDELLPQQRSRWNQIRGMIEIGAMPPADHQPQPEVDVRRQIAQWIDRRINRVDCDQARDAGRVTMRRLNNLEYDNTVRDLLAIDFSPSELIGFPADDVGDGFDNQGNVLTVSQLQLEKYMQAAAQIADRALTDPQSLSTRSSDMPSLYLGDERSLRFLFAEGEHEIKPRLQFSQAGDTVISVVVLVDGQPLETLEVTNRRKTYRLNHWLAAGWHELALRFDSDSEVDRKDRNRRVEIESIGVQGPPVETESYRRIVRVRPDDSTAALEAARQNLQPLIRRAYRRPPTPTDIERVISVVRMALDQGQPFERALGSGLQAILVSPHFLFRVEQEQPGEALDDHALASRLSYFLWASLPDDELLDLADAGQLVERAVLAAQVQRMLSDPRGQALVSGFFNQYLGLGNLRDVSPDPDRFPMWNDRLRVAVRRETELFCREIIQRDLPIETLLLGEFTFVNPRLAELYGIEFDGQDPAELFERGPGFYRGRPGERNNDYAREDHWLRVSTPAHRLGVLTHASVLTLTSNPTVTSPVKRGKWILETVLGEPPPPAPPNVPAFEETQQEHQQLTLREQLAIHRSNPSCASCHDVMDPLGLGFEHFDAVGRWRETDGGLPVDAAGMLADGRGFSGSIELVRLLIDSRPKIYRFFAEKLLTYALGRGLEPYDACAVDAILAHASQQDYRLSGFVTAVVASEPFTQRRLDIHSSGADP